MKIEIVENNVVLVNPSNENFEIHPLWLRERAKTENLVDKYNDQRLYDPSQLDQNLKIKKASMTNGHLNIEFTDGVKFDYEVNNLLYEIDRKEPVENIIFWNSDFNKIVAPGFVRIFFSSVPLLIINAIFSRFFLVTLSSTIQRNIAGKVPTAREYKRKAPKLSVGTPSVLLDKLYSQPKKPLRAKEVATIITLFPTVQ